MSLQMQAGVAERNDISYITLLHNITPNVVYITPLRNDISYIIPIHYITPKIVYITPSRYITPEFVYITPISELTNS